MRAYMLRDDGEYIGMATKSNIGDKEKALVAFKKLWATEDAPDVMEEMYGKQEITIERIEEMLSHYCGNCKFSTIDGETCLECGRDFIKGGRNVFVFNFIPKYVNS